MDAQFRKMDADKWGQLTRTKIEQFQKLTAIAEAQARNRALFAQLDADSERAGFARQRLAKPAAPSPPPPMPNR